MEVDDVINAVADEADELLGGISDRRDARPVIREHLKSTHPGLSETESALVVAGVLEILDEEGFFDVPSGPDLRYDGSMD